ncbi:MAG: hypothetical protein M1458_01850 [Deltaproteobacteria bacterium]|nr:hypothetical protein [Deltaproteobacteria bacterium]
MDYTDYRISNIIGHEKPIQFLNNLFARGGMPPGLIFYGQRNIGKRFVAASFAASVLCEDYSYYNGNPAEIKENSDTKTLNRYFCGKCPSCRGVLNGTNQNLMIVEPAGNSIKIEKINQINSLLNLTPAFKGHRFVIIDGAEAMNQNAANALLKTLEEPQGGTVFILISSNMSGLLPTIVSRCSLLAFRPVQDEVLFKAFRAKFLDMAGDVLRVYLRLAKGSYSNLEKLAGGGYFEMRKSILALIFNESFYRRQALFKYSMADEFNSILKNLKGNDSDNKNENEILLFEAFLFILRDIYIYYMTKNEKLLYNIDIKGDIGKFIEDSGITPRALLNMIELTVNYIGEASSYNLNKSIAMDAYFTDLLT